MNIKGLPGHEKCTSTKCCGPSLDFACTTTQGVYTAATGSVTGVEYKIMQDLLAHPAPKMYIKEAKSVETYVNNRSRFKEEVIRALESRKVKTMEDDSDDCPTCGGYRYLFDCHCECKNDAIQECIETIKKL